MEGFQHPQTALGLHENFSKRLNPDVILGRFQPWGTGVVADAFHGQAGGFRAQGLAGHRSLDPRSVIVAPLCGIFIGENDGVWWWRGAGTAGQKRSKRKPGKANHRREQCPMGRDPHIDAIKARQSLGLPLTSRLTEQQVKRAHKLLAVKHIPTRAVIQS